MVRRKLVAGNWKMNGLRADLAEIAGIAEAAARFPQVDVAVCPPATLIAEAAARFSGLMIGAQDCSQFEHGPHTGSISAAMLREAGARITITGHSERRAQQGEKDAAIRAKAKQAIAEGMVAIVCVGETGAERESGEAEAIVAGHVWGSVTKYARPETVIVSYEPVWAIGTGLTPAIDEIARMHAFIRQTLCHKLGEEIGSGIRILYGGSVTGENAHPILHVANVDGALVGGASLTAERFAPIIAAAAAS